VKIRKGGYRWIFAASSTTFKGNVVQVFGGSVVQKMVRHMTGKGRENLRDLIACDTRHNVLRTTAISLFCPGGIS
jgi:hypothetical protein